MIKYNTIATSETFPWPSAAAELNWWQLQMDSTVVCVGMILLQSAHASRHDNAVEGHKLGNPLAPVVWNAKCNEVFVCLSNTTAAPMRSSLKRFPVIQSASTKQTPVVRICALLPNFNLHTYHEGLNETDGDKIRLQPIDRGEQGRRCWG